MNKVPFSWTASYIRTHFVMDEKSETVVILGGDGYLGWSLGLAIAHRTNFRVVLVDNLVKRRWERQVGAKVLVPLPNMQRRLREYQTIFGKGNLFFEKADLTVYETIPALLKKYRPHTVINTAQQPSAPFAMMSPQNAACTFSNNIVGNLNVLWAIAEIDKSIRYIKLGSSGSYMSIDTDFVPLRKVDMSFEENGRVRRVLNTWFPMQANDFYHQSKISDFLVNDLCANIWNLRVITVQQATMFGATIPENEPLDRHVLSTRFNYDAVFGTVLNRFVCELAMGHPLTVYGNGTQETGLISLSDTVDNFMRFIRMPVEQGVHEVVHNYSHRLSIVQIAERLLAVAGAARVSYIRNPRREPTGTLNKTCELHSTLCEKEEGKDQRLLEELAGFLQFAKTYASNIDASLILPQVNWEKGKAQSNAKEKTRARYTRQRARQTLRKKKVKTEVEELKEILA